MLDIPKNPYYELIPLLISCRYLQQISAGLYCRRPLFPEKAYAFRSVNFTLLNSEKVCRLASSKVYRMTSRNVCRPTLKASLLHNSYHYDLQRDLMAKVTTATMAKT